MIDLINSPTATPRAAPTVIKIILQNFLLFNNFISLM
tara:strand:+ start:669 stop:779 length:111 start_codon:yes stop_codon:yes gene_type:complete